MVRAVTPIPFVKARFFDRCGKPLAGGKVYTYEANTTTPKVTYKDPYGLTPNTNPIILDAAGEADIYLDGTYRIRITDRNDVLVNDVEKIGSWFSDNLQDTLDNISGAMDDALKPILQNLDNAINTAAAAGAGANGWTDVLVTTQNGRTQRQKNLDTVNLLDYMTANELSAYQADATTFNAAPIFNRASIDCYNKKRKLMAYGTFYATETIVITSDCDLSQADIFTTASLGIDVRNVVDTASIKRLMNFCITLPRLLQYTPKTSYGWIADTNGVKFTNLYSCRVTTGQITNFETNLIISSSKTGNVYNDYYIGHLANGKINLLIESSNGGWTNENNFFGGRYSHLGGEGTNVPGTRHIKISNEYNTPNNNIFYKPSIEADVAEYHVECGGSYNTFLQARWEATNPKILYSCNDAIEAGYNQATKNIVIGGYNVDAISVVKSGTKAAFLNKVIGNVVEYNNINGDIAYRFSNKSGNTHPVMLGFDATTDIETAPLNSYTWYLDAYNLKGKKGVDTNPKIHINFLEGKVLVGKGTADPQHGIISFGNLAGWTGGDYLPVDSTYNLGTNTYRWKQLYLTSGFGAWGAIPPTSKPSVTGSRGGNAALASLITALASYGLITDNTTA